jgi:hypothetical protein
MAVLRTNVDFAKQILAQRVGNDYVYGGNWSRTNTSVGTDCSGLVVDILDATINGAGMAWSRHGMSTESWRPIEVGQVGPFGTICVAKPADFPADAAVKIAIHHGPGGGANSHTWCEVDGVRGESNGSDGCVTGTRARDVYDTSYANDWHYLPGPIGGAPPVLSKPDGYAVQIVQEGQRRNITPRGIQIALSVALVESGMKVYANSNVPESLNIPHDAVGSDHDSLGLFQQRCPMWGPAEVLMNPTLSAGLFYDRLVKLDYNNTANPPGDYAADVQRPAAEYRGRYQERMADAVALYNRLNNTTPGDDMALVPQAQWDAVYQELSKRFPSRSPLRHLDQTQFYPGGLVDTFAGMTLNDDGMEHVQYCIVLAGYNHPPTMALLNEIAAGDPGQYPDRAEDIQLAQAILNKVATDKVSKAVTAAVPSAAPSVAVAPVAVVSDAAVQRIADAAAGAVTSQQATPSPSGSIGQRFGTALDALEALKADLSPAGKATIDALAGVLQTETGASA